MSDVLLVGRRGIVAVLNWVDLAAEFVLDGGSISGPDLISQVVDQL